MQIVGGQDVSTAKLLACSTASSGTALIGQLAAQDVLLWVSIAVQAVLLIYGLLKTYYLIRKNKQGVGDDPDQPE